MTMILSMCFSAGNTKVNAWDGNVPHEFTRVKNIKYPKWWGRKIASLKQLTETTDNVYRYGLLQKLGAGRRQINHTLFVQTAVFFAIPLVVAGVYSAFLIGKAMAAVEEFMNIHIATNIGLTIVLFLLVYGSYFLATYLSCKRIVTEQRELEV